MKKLLFTLLLVLIGAEVFGQSSPNSTWRRDGDTTISRTDKVRVPVYLKVGRRPDDPFPTYLKTFLAADSVASDSHYVVLSSWLSIPIATSTLQHAMANEIYYTAETDTMENNLVGQELSVNVPGRLIFDRATNHYGIYGLIVNGTVKNTNGNGFMQGRRFVGIYVDLGDVTPGAQVDSIRFDTTVGIWIPSLDGGRPDSAFKKFSIIAANNIYTGDSMLVADRLILGVGTSDSAWFGADTISGITHWTTKGAVVPVINSRSNTSETGMLRLLGDSAQIRILHTLGATYIQFGDSAFTASDSVYLTAYSSNNLNKLEIRANKFDIRTAGNYTYRLPVTAPTGTGQVIAVSTAPTPDSLYWTANGGGLDSATAEGYFISEGGDTVASIAFPKIWKFHGHIDIQTLDSVATISGSTDWGLSLLPYGTTDLYLGYAILPDVGMAGQIRFYQGSTERMQVDNDSLKGMGRMDIKDYIRAFIDSLIADRLYAMTAAVDTLTGRDTGVPTMGDPLDMNGYSMWNIDTANGNVANFTTYLNIVADSSWAFNVTTSATGTEYITTSKRIKARPGANVVFSREDSTTYNLFRVTVPDDSIWAVVEDSLDNVQYVYLEFNPESWDRPLADSIFVLGRHRIFKDTDSARAMLCLDSCSAISEPKADTLYFSVAMPYAGSIDTVGLVMNCSGTAESYLTNYSLIGPDRANGLNGCDSTYQTWGDDLTYQAFTYVPLDNADKVVQKGDIWGMRIIVNHTADTEAVRIGWIRFAFRRIS